MSYFYNTTTLKTIYTDNPGRALYSSPYQAATQGQIDTLDFDNAKISKYKELEDALSDFEKDGYTYTGNITCIAWNSGTTYAKKDLALAIDTNNYKSKSDSNLDHEPPNGTWWAAYSPVFKTNDKTTNNIILADRSPVSDPNKYIFGAKGNIKINFDNATDWDSFFDAIICEKNRIMRENDVYNNDIDLATTISELDAITIDFSV